MKEEKADKVTFPSIYAPNSVKETEDYAKQVFRGALNATSAYREARAKQVTKARQYAQGKQSITQYLDELSIEGSKQYVNINYSPTKILQKFEKIVVDDYQQLKEKSKVIAKAYQIQLRKDRKKADLRFRMEFGSQIAELEQAVGFPLEDQSQKVPEDEDELDLIMSLNPDEREEVLMREMVEKVLRDNDVETLKRSFLSDLFQVNIAGIHHYTDRKGKIKVEFIQAEDAIYDTSRFEEFNKDIAFAGKATMMNIAEIRDLFNIPREKEEQLYKLAHTFRTNYGNSSFLGDYFNNNWYNAHSRPYDEFRVPVYHLWKKTYDVKGYVEGYDSYGKEIFDIDEKITEEKLKGSRKKTGTSNIETAYEGWFAGNIHCPVVLEWGKQVNQVREGKNKEVCLCPYIFFMPDNRGSMMEESAVERVISEVQTLDVAMLKIKLTLANHPPAGYAIDIESLMDIDLGDGTMSPLDIDDIYKQTGKLFMKRTTSEGQPQQALPIVPLDISIQNSISTYLTVYNTALNNIRDILGINANREGTANLNRVSNGAMSASIAISQTATYYLYRGFLKAMNTLVTHLGIRIVDVLRFGNPDKGYLSYLGEENIEFIKSREEILASNYVFEYNASISKEEEERLVGLVNAGVASRELEMPDALLILEVKDYAIASRLLRYYLNKKKKADQEHAIQVQQAQAEAQGQASVQAEEARRQTIQVEQDLQTLQWKVKGESAERVAQTNVINMLLQAKLNGTELSPKEQQLVDLFLDNALTTQEQSLIESEEQIESKTMQEEQDQAVMQAQQAVESGQMAEQEAMEELQKMGIQM